MFELNYTTGILDNGCYLFFDDAIFLQEKKKQFQICKINFCNSILLLV